MSTTTEDIRISRLEDAGQLPVICPWCFRAVGPDEDEIEVKTATDEVYHARCRWQEQDEDELREFLEDTARACLDRIKEYRSLHPTRVLEHRASALLARLAAVVDVAVDHASEPTSSGPACHGK